MTDTITPALTPEEWHNLAANTLALNVMFDASPWGRAPEGDHFREMAIANWKLPDDDPRKITREDVEALQLADDRIRGEWDHPNNPEPPTLQRLAAKLAALLPPK